MADALVARLRAYERDDKADVVWEAADRIEQLVRENEALTSLVTLTDPLLALKSRAERAERANKAHARAAIEWMERAERAERERDAAYANGYEAGYRDGRIEGAQRREAE